MKLSNSSWRRDTRQDGVYSQNTHTKAEHLDLDYQISRPATSYRALFTAIYLNAGSSQTVAIIVTWYQPFSVPFKITIPVGSSYVPYIRGLSGVTCKSSFEDWLRQSKIKKKLEHTPQGGVAITC